MMNPIQGRKINSLPPIPQLTREQLSIVQSPAPAILVDAVSGSGKTTVLRAIAAQNPRGLYLTHSKSIALELEADIKNRNWHCITFYSLGYRIRSNKEKQHGRSHPAVNFKKHENYTANKDATKLAMHHIQMAGNVTDASWEDTCTRFRMPKGLIKSARQVYDDFLNDQTEISADEMMHHPVANGWKTAGTFDIVLVDDCEDLNPLQLEMLKLIKTRKLVLVGDRNQAIYGFRGTVVDVFDQLDTTYSPAHFQLTETFRCPQKVVQAARNFTPHINTNKPGGYVTDHKGLDINLPDDCLVLARSNMTLLQMAHKLIQKREHFSLSTSAIESMQKDFYDNIGEDNKTVEEALQNLKKKKQDMLDRFNANGWDDGYIKGHFTNTESLLKMFTTMDAIRNFFNSLDTKKKHRSSRRLMSIHAAKGMEHKNVYLLNRQDCFNMIAWSKISWQKKQERNLVYLACTRSTENLTFVDF